MSFMDGLKGGLKTSTSASYFFPETLGLDCKLVYQSPSKFSKAFALCTQHSFLSPLYIQHLISQCQLLWYVKHTYILFKISKDCNSSIKILQSFRKPSHLHSLALQIQHLIYQCQLLFLLKNFKIRHLESNLKICAYLLNLLMNWQRIWNCRYVVCSTLNSSRLFTFTNPSKYRHTHSQ